MTVCIWKTGSIFKKHDHFNKFIIYKFMILSGIMFFLLPFLFTTTTFAESIEVLITPGSERDALQIKHEMTLENNKKDLIALQELGIILHMQVVESEKGNFENIKGAYKILKKAYILDKNHVITMAYYGSITTMLALTTEDKMRKLKYVKSGSRKLDKAVKIAPDDINVRMIRGGNSLSLPKFLKRARLAVIDFQHVLDIFPNSSSEFKSNLHSKIAKGYLLMDDHEKADNHRNLALKK